MSKRPIIAETDSAEFLAHIQMLADRRAAQYSHRRYRTIKIELEVDGSYAVVEYYHSGGGASYSTLHRGDGLECAAFVLAYQRAHRNRR